MKYFYQTLLKAFVVTFVSLFVLAPTFASAQVSGKVGDIAPADIATEGMCISLTSNFGYRATDQTTSGSVSLLQDFLISKGYLNSESTGYFGGMTLKAVTKYQNDKGFNATGYVGNYTRGAIRTDTCGNTVDRMPSDPVPPTNVGGGTSSGSGSQTSDSMKVVIVDRNGKPSTSSYFKCGDKTARDYILRAPNSKGEVTFNASDCRKKGAALWISCPVGQVASFSSETLADFRDQMVVTCATADYIKKAADAVAQANGVTSSSTTVVTGTYVAYLNGSQTPFITTQNLSEAAALVNCTTNHTSNIDRQLRCLWNGKEIGNYTGFPSPAVTGTYLAFLDGSQTPFITTQNLSEAAAISNCNTNHASNQNHALKCVWNGKVIGEYSTELTTKFYVNGKEVSGGIVALSGDSVMLEWLSSGASTCYFNGEKLDTTSGSKRLSTSGLTTSSHTYKCTSVTGQSVSKTFSISLPSTCNDTGTFSNGAMCAPPAPTLSLKINGRGIAKNESVSLSTNQAVVEWESLNARSCALDNQTIPTSGSNTSTGLTTRSYVYTCTNSAGVSTSMPFSLVVSGSNGEVGAPTLAVYVNEVRVTNGSSVKLTDTSARVRWESSGAVSCKLKEPTKDSYNIPTSGSNISTGLSSNSYIYTCLSAGGQSSSLAFSTVVPTVSGDSPIVAPVINEFSLDKPNLPSNQSATLSYYFWGPGPNSEKAMMCNILTYNKATGQTQTGNTLVQNTLETAGSFEGKRTFEGKDYPSGARITAECRNPAGSISKSIDLNVVAPVVAVPVPGNLKLFVNGTNASALTVTQGDTVMTSWSADNVVSGGVYYFYLDGVQKSSSLATSASGSTDNLFGSVTGAHTIYFTACNGSTCSAPSTPVTITINPRAAATTWVNAAARCSDWVGIPSALITSGPNPIPSNYTVGNIGYQYDSANPNNIRNINTTSCSAPAYVAPVATWVNGSAQCQAYVGVPSPLIVSGPNPIPAGYTMGTISYQYESTNVNNIRNLNTSGCYAPAGGTTWINATAPCSRYVGITSPLITSGPNPIPNDYVHGTISYQYDASNASVIRNINTSACSATAMLNTATPLATLGTTLQNAFSAVNSNITKQTDMFVAMLTGATRASAATESSNVVVQPEVTPVSAPSKTCVNITSNLHRGNETSAVSKLQSFLIGKGILSEKVSGFYGDYTVDAVKTYQQSVGLPETGMVYGATRAAIAEETCN